MAGPGGSSARHPELARLRRACALLRAGRPTSRLSVEQALEDGFGRLVLLEAQLQRARRAAEGSPGEGQMGGPAADVVELERWIAELREVLVELRDLSSPPGPGRSGYGFVLGEREAGDEPSGPR